MIIHFITAAAVLLAAQLCFAGTVTNSSEAIGTVQKLTCTWTAATNAHSGVTANTEPVIGTLRRVVILPTTTTTGELYSIILKDSYGNDVLGGKYGAAATGTLYNIAPGIGYIGSFAATSIFPWVAYDTLTAVVTNCGASAKGGFVLYITPP